MTNAELCRRFRERHRYRLPWAGDVPFHPELAAWEASALKGRARLSNEGDHLPTPEIVPGPATMRTPKVAKGGRRLPLLAV